MNVKYEKSQVAIADLKLTYSIFELLKIEVSDFYTAEAKYLNWYESPVVTEDLTVLTNIDAVKAAIKNNVEHLEVVIAKGLNENDCVRMCNYSVHARKINRLQRYDLIMFFEDYLKNNPKGIEWADTLKGSINHKIGTILGFDHETIKLTKRLKKKTLEAFSETELVIDNRTDEVVQIEKQKKETKKTKRVDQLVSKFKLEDFRLNIDKETSSFFYKGKEFKMVMTEIKGDDFVSYTYNAWGGGAVKIIIEKPSKIYDNNSENVTIEIENDKNTSMSEKEIEEAEKASEELLKSIQSELGYISNPINDN